MSDLKPCPCGKTPTELCIREAETYRWRRVGGNCCGDWETEARVDYGASDEQILRDCNEAWNAAARAQPDN